MKKSEEQEILKAVNGTQYDRRITGFIQPDEEIEFECQRCGECCKHRDSNGQQIMVSPLDIWNACNELNISVDEFIETYTTNYIGSDSGVVVVVLACDDEGTCKLLEYDENGLAKCRIHNASPAICAIHPLGIVHSMTQHNGKIGKASRGYCVAEHCSTSRCGKMVKAQTLIDAVKGTDEEVDIAMEVRAGWLPEKGVKYSSDILMLYAVLSEAIMTDEEWKNFGSSEKFRKMTKKVHESFENNVGPSGIDVVDTEKIARCVTYPMALKEANFELSYKKYDPSKPFLPQCKENLEQLKKISKEFEQCVSEAYDKMTSKLSKKQKERFPMFMKYMGFIVANELQK